MGGGNGDVDDRLGPGRDGDLAQAGRHRDIRKSHFHQGAARGLDIEVDQADEVHGGAVGQQLQPDPTHASGSHLDHSHWRGGIGEQCERAHLATVPLIALPSESNSGKNSPE